MGPLGLTAAALLLVVLAPGVVRLVRYPDVTLRRDGRAIQILRSDRPWRTFDPSRDRIISVRYKQRFSTASIEDDALVTAEIDGRCCRFRLDFSADLELLTNA